MNRPLDYIHDPLHSYGWLVLPLGKRWLYWTPKYGFKLTDKFGFHNCRETGVR